MLNYYRRFLPHSASTQIPLLDLTKGNKKKDTTPIIWNTKTLTAFQKCKDDLANASQLAHPSDNKPISLMVDASDHAIGGVVNQLNQCSWQPLAFFSHRLNPAQKNYSTYSRHQRNLLAVKFQLVFYSNIH